MSYHLILLVEPLIVIVEKLKMIHYRLCGRLYSEKVVVVVVVNVIVFSKSFATVSTSSVVFVFDIFPPLLFYLKSVLLITCAIAGFVELFFEGTPLVYSASTNFVFLGYVS